MKQRTFIGEAVARLDRYDWAVYAVTGVAMSAAVMLYAPLWVVAVILLLGGAVIIYRDFLRYVRQYNERAARDGTAPLVYKHPFRRTQPRAIDRP